MDWWMDRWINFIITFILHLLILSMSLAKVLFHDWHLIHSCCLIFWKRIRTILLANFNFSVVSEEAVSWSFLFLIPEVFLFPFDHLLFFLWFCTLQTRNVTNLDRQFRNYMHFTLPPRTNNSTTLSSRTYRWYLFSFYTWARDRSSDKGAKPKQLHQSAMW